MTKANLPIQVQNQELKSLHLKMLKSSHAGAATASKKLLVALTDYNQQVNKLVRLRRFYRFKSRTDATYKEKVRQVNQQLAQLKKTNQTFFLTYPEFQAVAVEKAMILTNRMEKN